uniref:Uncharacterized protein n=1 Tax=Anguilla anguilla TaxID=7936 RepID=A0A0E9VJP5_ANGAN
MLYLSVQCTKHSMLLSEVPVYITLHPPMPSIVSIGLDIEKNANYQWMEVHTRVIQQ